MGREADLDDATFTPRSTEALKGEDWVLTNGSSQGKENLYLAGG